MRPLTVLSRMLPFAVLAAVATVAAAAPSITVYTHDLGLVHERRTVTLAGARDTLRLADVPERLDFGSVRLVAGSGRVTRLAWRYDLPAGDDLLARTLGRRVRLVARDNRVVEGVLTAADGSWVLVRSDDGTLHTVARAAVEDVQLTGIAAPLAVRPTLEVVVEGARPGRQEIELAYLTGGLSWTAEHTLVRRGEREAEWSSRATVQNTSGMTWADAALALVAGEPRRVAPEAPPVPMAMERAMVSQAKADLSASNFSEYHLYELPHPALLRDRESQSLSMIEPRTVHVTPRYLYRGGDPSGVTAQLRIANREAEGLGLPIAAGRVRIYEPDTHGVVRLAGEDAIRHTPAGDTLTLDIGQAFDLTAERQEVESRRISDRERESTVAITLRNHKSTPVTIVVEDPVPGDFELLRSSLPVTRRVANTLTFTVPVAPDHDVTVRYTVRIHW